VEVTYHGARAVSRRELQAELLAAADPALRKIKPLSELLEISRERRARGEKMAFTNGCFDLLHLGHLNLIQFARRQGDYLVVGLNTDRGVKALKGPSRPVNNQEIRARILAGLEDVDYVVMFDTESVLPLIQQIKPDVLVKGGDYPKTGVVGWEFVEGYGGRVALAPQVKGLSTTEIIQRMSTGDEQQSGRKQ
jgi:D-beta-D-heptose 7-phosphate kinase/D-beta-D-heptose 1-phosphate adenosyltransferase